MAVGGNREAARIAGVPVRRIIFSVYVLSGLLAGVATVLLCARLGSASPVSGNLYELDAIGAVVIGGTSLAGGRATIVGTFLGVLTFALIFSLMTQLNLSTEVQQVVKGVHRARRGPAPAAGGPVLMGRTSPTMPIRARQPRRRHGCRSSDFIISIAAVALLAARPGRLRQQRHRRPSRWRHGAGRQASDDRRTPARR